MAKISAAKSRKNNCKEEDTSVGCGCCIRRNPRLDNFFGEICQESTAHGVKFIGSKKRHPAERIFWAIIFVGCLGFSSFLVARVVLKFDENPVIISFQSKETSVSQIPFPAITICNVNLLKSSELNNQVDYLEILLLQNMYNETHAYSTPEILEKVAHIDHLAQSCLATPSFRRRLKQTLLDANGELDFIEQLNDIVKGLDANDTAQMLHIERNRTFWKKDHDLFRKTLISCEDMLIKCIWANNPIPCKDIFVHIETLIGHCCVFNMMPKFILQNIPPSHHHKKSPINVIPNATIDEWIAFGKGELIVENMTKLEEINYPKHQKAGGKPYGLKVLANPGLEEYSTCTTNDGSGFKVMAHSPLSSPRMALAAAVPIGSEAFIDIEPRATVVAKKDWEKLKAVPIVKRGCYMPSDPQSTLTHYNFYSAQSCFTECWARYRYKNCSCVRYSMPRNASQRICGAKERACANQVLANLRKSVGNNAKCRHCLPPCTQIEYKLHVSHFDLREGNVSSYYPYTHSDDGLKNATEYSILHFYIGTDSFYAKERKMLYDWIDLLEPRAELAEHDAGRRPAACFEKSSAYEKLKLITCQNINELTDPI